MKFGLLLRQFRLRSGISQKKLAEPLPVDNTYLSKIENNYRNPPSRNIVVNIATTLNLNPVETDKLLLSANYSPINLFDDEFGNTDIILNKQKRILGRIKKDNKKSLFEAKEEISDFLDYIRLKYIENSKDKENIILANYLYSYIRKKGINVIYEAINKPLGGAIVIKDNKILLQQIGISPLKGVWCIPSGFVNPRKGDRAAEDIAIRLVKKIVGRTKLIVTKELTTKEEILEKIDTTDYFIKLGLFPSIFKIFAIKIDNEIHIKVKDALFISFNNIVDLEGDIHPLLYQIVGPYINDPRIIKKLFDRGQETIQKIVNKENAYLDLKYFSYKRVSKV